MEHDKTGFEASPEGPILCINNCGFFGSAATMNMCSKCHKDMILKQQAKLLAASSIENIVNGSTSSNNNLKAVVDVQVEVSIESSSKVLSVSQGSVSSAEMVAVTEEAKGKGGPKRCFTCKKRVGLTGFLCRCENMFCGSHRYSDKHECPFDYVVAGQDAIAKANPVVKADKLDKI
ncbi:zinc finger A20 and AN1 domain-containing stress-associated protein 8-like [Impatiens glandulifera]|uniref:zinc finger A20 and AN1 domain-containing stress-associated protein 8-like n=1 Tax=Impatiens glandulifera TaxID=253017 RepID=UPI001FB11292|nr:zinc finger A20 and AN1 domain-containing stress-associated protein 8-like [Impatiens glandulifera]XP_047330785.1 zinc finger A20 and AN1 domain-containing stress-associated protein 8-like [Impatiens glandulifera]